MSPADQPAPERRPAPPIDPDVEAVLGDPAALWHALQRTSGEYLAVVDRGGIIRECSRVDEGFVRDQVVGHSIVRFTLAESSAALLDVLRHVFDTGNLRTLETTVRRIDGGLNYFALRLGPIHRDGRIVAVMVCCENIRPLKDTEQALTRERNVLKTLLEIQERERQLVSYEIHDGLAQYLAGALMHLQAYAHEQGTRAAPRNFEEGLRLLTAAVAESRRLIGGLRPPALDELGIVDAVEVLVTDARADVPRITFTHVLPGDRLPPQLETILFRVVQEAITNARRHAGAKSLAVSLVRTDGHVTVRVEDDGKGFDPGGVAEGRFGLEGIRQRCRLLGGEARITSAPGVGTTVEATFPIPAAG